MPEILTLNNNLKDQTATATLTKTQIYTYDSSIKRPTLGYCADAGGVKGQILGQMIAERCHHLTFGGDADYQQASINEFSLSANFFNKFPSIPVSFEFGNHERGVEGKKTGHFNQINYLAANLASQSHQRFATHDINQKGIAEPFVDYFIDQSKKQKPFTIIHLDSSILPYHANYADKIRDLIIAIQLQYKNNCHIVLSLHHAPISYNKRRTSFKDADKYLGHLVTCGIIDEQQKNYFILNAHQKQIETAPHHAAAGNWNQCIKYCLAEIYTQVITTCGALCVIATQSGHDHFAHIAAPKHQPVAIIQGNGSAEGIHDGKRQTAIAAGVGKSQQAHPAYAQHGITGNKLFGCDYNKPQHQACYLQLGYGEWRWDNQGNPYYTQLIYQNGKMVPVTQIRFSKNDNHSIIYDYTANKAFQHNISINDSKITSQVTPSVKKTQLPSPYPASKPVYPVLTKNMLQTGLYEMSLGMSAYSGFSIG
jgi:hypothetical protein